MAGKRRKSRKGDPAGVARAQAELQHSLQRAETTEREVVAPLTAMRRRNNVTGLVDRLMHEIRHAPNGGTV